MQRSIARRSQVHVEQLDDRLCLSTSPMVTLAPQVVEMSHGVTVLAWARVDGVSPLQQNAAPAQAGTHYFNGRLLTQRDFSSSASIAVADEVFAAHQNEDRAPSGGTTQDDVIVDGGIITGENYDSSTITQHGYIRIKKLNSGG